MQVRSVLPASVSWRETSGVYESLGRVTACKVQYVEQSAQDIKSALQLAMLLLHTLAWQTRRHQLARRSSAEMAARQLRESLAASRQTTAGTNSSPSGVNPCFENGSDEVATRPLLPLALNSRDSNLINRRIHLSPGRSLPIRRLARQSCVNYRKLRKLIARPCSRTSKRETPSASSSAPLEGESSTAKNLRRQ